MNVKSNTFSINVKCVFSQSLRNALKIRCVTLCVTKLILYVVYIIIMTFVLASNPPHFSILINTSIQTYHFQQFYVLFCCYIRNIRVTLILQWFVVKLGNGKTYQ